MTFCNNSNSANSYVPLIVIVICGVLSTLGMSVNASDFQSGGDQGRSIGQSAHAGQNTLVAIGASPFAGQVPQAPAEGSDSTHQSESDNAQKSNSDPNTAGNQTNPKTSKAVVTKERIDSVTKQEPGSDQAEEAEQNQPPEELIRGY